MHQRGVIIQLTSVNNVQYDSLDIKSLPSIYHRLYLLIDNGNINSKQLTWIRCRETARVDDCDRMKHVSIAGNSFLAYFLQQYQSNI